MSQQQRPGSTDEKTASTHLRTVRDDSAAAGAPVHCGRAMPVRLLDFTDVHDRVNHAVAQAAVDGRQVHACACGVLQEAPRTGGAAASIVPEGRTMLFRPFFARRVLAAVGRVETAEWSFDQALADADDLAPRDAEEPVQPLWAFEAGLESERWRLDQATEVLRDELRLAVDHGVPIALLAREAALDETTVVDLLHPGDVPAEFCDGAPELALTAAAG